MRYHCTIWYGVTTPGYFLTAGSSVNGRTPVLGVGHPAPAERRRRACWARSRAVAVGPFTARSCNTSTAAAICSFNRSRVCALAASSSWSWLIPWPPLPARLEDLAGARSRHRPGDRRNPGAVRSQPPAGPAVGADQQTGPAPPGPGQSSGDLRSAGLEVVHRVTDHDRADALGRAGGYWHVLRFRPSAGVPGSVADRYREVAGPFGLRCFVTHVPLPVRRACRGVAVGQPRRTPLVVVAPSSGDQPAAVPGCCCRATGFLRCSDPAEIVPGNPGALHAGPRNALARCWARRTVTASRPSPAPTAATCPAGQSR